MDNIQRMLIQLLENQNNKNTTGNEEVNLDNEPPKSEESKKGSSVNADMIKGIQAQVASLAQRDELKRVRMTSPYPLEWDSVQFVPKFKPPTLHTYDGKSSPN